MIIHGKKDKKWNNLKNTPKTTLFAGKSGHGTKKKRSKNEGEEIAQNRREWQPRRELQTFPSQNIARDKKPISVFVKAFLKK